MGLAAIAPTLEMAHGPGQTVLEILGARLAGEQLLDEDELDEMSDNMQINNCSKSESENEEDNSVMLFGTLQVIQTGQRPVDSSHANYEGEEPEPIFEDNNVEYNPVLTNFNPDNEIIEAEQRMGTYLESQYSRSTFINPSTGRTNQILVCR